MSRKHREVMIMTQKVKAIDTSLCQGCKGCQVACKHWNQLPGNTNPETFAHNTYQNPPDMNYFTWNLMTYREVYSPETNQFRWIFRQDCCRHCPDPFCKIGCPVNDVKATDPGNEGKTVSVITKNEEIGAVIYNNRYCDFQNTDKEGKEHCCQECLRACPYNVPRFEFDPETKKEFRRAYKCTLCIDRLTQLDESHQLNEVDRIPACVKTCAAKGLQFGDRETVLSQVRERVNEGSSLAIALQEFPGVFPE